MRKFLATVLLCAGLAGCAHFGETEVGGQAAVPGFSVALRVALPAVAGVYGVGDPFQPADGLPTQAHGTLPMSLGERAPWSSNDIPVSVGAGFFIDGLGTLVTAAHVVDGARQVLVKLADQRVLVARVVGQDLDMDIAVLQVSGADIQAPALGRSAASRPGDWVLAVGEPYGLRRSVVAGIVAGPVRHFAEDREGLFIQSDLSLNPGNSGGPLLNPSGAIIGMNLRSVVGPFGAGGISLSIPIEVVVQIARELQTGKGRLRPRLGAGFEDVSPWVARGAGRSHASGALISDVLPDSRAEHIGLKPGDIVVGMNDWPIGDSADLARRLLAWHALARTRLVIWREGRYQSLEWR